MIEKGVEKKKNNYGIIQPLKNHNALEGRGRSLCALQDELGKDES